MSTYLSDHLAIEAKASSLLRSSVGSEAEISATALSRLEHIFQYLEMLPAREGAISYVRGELIQLFNRSLLSGVLSQAVREEALPTEVPGWYVSFAPPEVSSKRVRYLSLSRTELSLEISINRITDAFTLKFSVAFDEDHAFFGVTDRNFWGQLSFDPTNSSHGKFCLDRQVGFLVNKKLVGTQVCYDLAGIGPFNWSRDGYVRHSGYVEDFE